MLTAAMAYYDFKNLSPVDFETLSRDLLQEELGIRFESFKVGRDKGIDFRYCPSSNESVVIQCKHYAESGVGPLLQELKKEAPKAKLLPLVRYILVTSVPLSVESKEKIVEIYKSASVLVHSGDVFSQADLNNLLERHPKVHKLHFKLWISSTETLERILNAGTYNISDDTLERLRATAAVYVHNPSFGHAMTILEKENLCVIAGIPGIGKTTLAEMLVLYFVQEGYEFIRITQDIGEAVSLDHHSTPRIFYYDDFLGKTSLADKLNKNEDQRLIEFFRAIRKSGRSKIVVTTREYILQQARTVYEAIGNWSLEHQICVVRLQDYTRRIRAQILFNHLFFSELGSDLKVALAKSKQLLEIIDHQNYNPRLIEYLTDANRIGARTPEDYLHHCAEVLNDPFAVWEHAFHSQLSIACRNLLMVLATLPSEVRSDHLERAFWLFHRRMSDKFGFNTHPNDFRSSLKESDGNFTSSERKESNVLVKFHNPSAADYVEGQIVKQSALLEVILDTCEFEEQLRWLWNFRAGDSKTPVFQQRLASLPENTGAALRRFLNQESCRLIPTGPRGGPWTLRVWSSSVESRLTFALEVASTLNEKTYEQVEASLHLASERTENCQSERDDVLNLLKLLKRIDRLGTRAAIDLFQRAKRFLTSELTFLEDFDVATDFLDTFSGQVSKEDRIQIREVFEGVIADPFSVLSDADDPRSINQDLETIKTVGNRLNIPTGDVESSLEERVAMLEEDTQEDDRYPSGSVDKSDYFSDYEISSMFGLLSD